jgi:hypothetical protein
MWCWFNVNRLSSQESPNKLRPRILSSLKFKLLVARGSISEIINNTPDFYDTSYFTFVIQ